MKLFSKSDFAAILMILFLSIFALKSLAIPGFYTSHDGVTHTARIAQYYQALKDGQFPPRWAGTLNKDFGSPIFVYIYPLPYFFGSVIHSLGFSFTDSFEILMALTFIFSGIFSFMWFKEVWQNSKAAFVGAIFYTWVPYRFVLIYVRASISESFAYTFAPLVFWSMIRLSKNINPKWVATCALFIGFLLLSQNLVAGMVLPVVLAYSLILAIFQKSIKFIQFTFISYIWAFLISAITYTPALFERHFIRFDESFRSFYVGQFVTLKQLIHSPWGYGFSFGGTDQDGMSFQIGLAHILVVLTVILVLVMILFSKFKNVRLFKKLTPKNLSRIHFSVVIFFLSLYILSVFLMLDTDLTHLFWKIFKPIGMIDRPWRILGITAISTSFLASFVIWNFKSKILVIIMTVAVLIANRNHLRINLPDIYDDDFYTNYTRDSATQLNEFTPKWRPTAQFEYRPRIEVINGDPEILNVYQKSNLVSFNTESANDAQVRINVLYFPGWEVYIDGNELKKDMEYFVPTEISDLIQDPNTLGVFEINIPSGKHRILLKFRETPLRKSANMLSAGSITLALVIAINRFKFRYHDA